MKMYLVAAALCRPGTEPEDMDVVFSYFELVSADSKEEAVEIYNKSMPYDSGVCLGECDENGTVTIKCASAYFDILF